MKMQAICDSLVASLSLPFLKVKTDDNLCSNVSIHGAFDAKEDWSNGIFHNGKYFIIMINPSGRWYTEGDKVTAEMISSQYKIKKMRRYTNTPEKVIKHICTWVEITRATK